MIKEALKYIVGLGETQTLNFDGDNYTNREIYRVEGPLAQAITTTTLTSIVDYIKNNVDDNKMSDRNLLIHIKSPNTVVLESDLNKDRKRETYIVAVALTPDINFDRFMDAERFNIMLQSSFVEKKDRSIVLKVAGNIQDSAVKTYGDDGTSQTVSIKAGVASIADVVVPNPVYLAPYRTFPEVEQPDSRFIFRMKEGAQCALFEADGGAWRNVAMDSIKKYLEEELNEYDVDIIS